MGLSDAIARLPTQMATLTAADALAHFFFLRPSLITGRVTLSDTQSSHELIYSFTCVKTPYRAEPCAQEAPCTNRSPRFTNDTRVNEKKKNVIVLQHVPSCDTLLVTGDLARAAPKLPAHPESQVNRAESQHFLCMFWRREGIRTAMLPRDAQTPIERLTKKKNVENLDASLKRIWLAHREGNEKL